MNLSREAQVVVVCTVVYVILSFFAWQSSGSFSLKEWDGVGVFAALTAVILLIWEIGRMLDEKLELGSLDAATVSLLLPLVLLFFTVATIIASSYLNWPAWIGLILSIVIAGAAYVRAESEGIVLPRVAMPASRTMSGTPWSGGAATATTTMPVEPEPEPEEPEPEEPEPEEPGGPSAAGM